MKATGDRWAVDFGPARYAEFREKRAKALATLKRRGLGPKTFPYTDAGRAAAEVHRTKMIAALDAAGIEGPRPTISHRFSLAI